MNAKWCRFPSDIPTGDHYAIIEFSTIHVPGDERSISYPGHGYPARDEPVQRYIAYTDRIVWERDVVLRTGRTDRNNFVALIVSRPEVKVQVTIQD